MMFPHAVMKDYHPMIGVDFHICVPPPIGPPIPMTPYRTAMVLHGTVGWFLTVRYCPSHFSAGMGFTMARGTDIGPLIPHIGPPSVPLPMEILFSASKSHFGPRSYVEKDNTGADSCVAAALGGFVNPNLNCGTPCPTPTGMVLALNTHGVGMTLGDITAGMTQMVIDTVVQTVLFHAGNAVGDRLGKIAGKFLPQEMSRAASRRAFSGANIGDKARALRAAQNAKSASYNLWAGRGIGSLVNIFGGGPMGADAGARQGPTAFGAISDLGGSEGEPGPFGKYVANGGDTYANYFNGGPPPANEGSAPIVPMF